MSEGTTHIHIGEFDKRTMAQILSDTDAKQKIREQKIKVQYQTGREHMAHEFLDFAKDKVEMKPYLQQFAQTQADPTGFLADHALYELQLNQEREEAMRLGKDMKGASQTPAEYAQTLERIGRQNAMASIPQRTPSGQPVQQQTYESIMTAAAQNIAAFERTAQASNRNRGLGK